jgi:glycosyltransferase involved in cell wall biosynthesis
MAEKIGLSLATATPFEVHIIAFPSAAHPPLPLHAHPLPFTPRLGLKRLLLPWYVLRKVLELKPKLLIITTHELLLAAALARLIISCKVIYDLQENYYRNIRHTSVYPFALRPFLALYVRLKEVMLSPIVNHFFLAEKGYEKEFGFQRKRYTVLENKLKLPTTVPPVKKDHYQLLFSGTLAETTGIFKAIEIAVKLHTLEPRISLLIIGYCSQANVLRQIESAIATHNFIRLEGGGVLVPHSSILERIQASGAGIIAYPHNNSTSNAIPTKLYEYLGYKLPILLTSHAPWVALCEPYNAAVVFDFHHIDAATLLHSLKTRQFYATSPDNVFWESEHSRLINAVQPFLS